MPILDFPIKLTAFSQTLINITGVIRQGKQRNRHELDKPINIQIDETHSGDADDSLLYIYVRIKVSDYA
jgi:hypothetical protein